jgi:hypothetical protein
MEGFGPRDIAGIWTSEDWAGSDGGSMVDP